MLNCPVNNLIHSLGNYLVLHAFSTLHLNICSLPKNYNHLKIYLSTLTHSFSVMMFSETRLNDDITCLYISVSLYCYSFMQKEQTRRSFIICL